MKKYFYFLSVIAMAMLAVSCDGIDGDNPNEDVPEIIDPFLGDIVPNDYTTNQANFEVFTNILLNSCYNKTDWYEKQPDNTWLFQDNSDCDGLAGYTYMMIDSSTLLEYICNASLGPYDVPKFNKYTVAYDAKTGTIYTTEILPDGTNGVTHSGKLLASTPKPVIEGKFGTLRHGNCEHIRWCFEERTERAELLEKYAKWLSEQE
ncbi:MAG: hypothetical protein ACI35T_03885 [Alistipes sp.]